MSTDYSWLNRPLQIGKLTLKHRMIMGPMGNRMWTSTGEPRPGLIEFFMARVRGGVSLVTVGTGQPHAGYENFFRPALWRDGNIGPLKTVSDAIHSAGVPVFIQLQHDGPGGNPGVSPSGVPCLTISKHGLTESRALSTDEVIDMREQFIAASRRAQQAGFDGVELGGQAGYLLGQFFSARMNLRTDTYGGSEANRMRLALEMVQGIRTACGPDFIVGYAMSVAELKPGGNTLEDSLPFARALQQAGLGYLDVRVGTHDTFALSDKVTGHNRYQSRDGIWEYSAKLKQALTIPVFCSSQGSYDPQRWEQALATGEADIIQLGKPLLADPEIANKVLRGDAREVRPCTYCMWCLDPKMFFSKEAPRTFCTVNVEAGAEIPMRLQPAATPRRVVVIGGGPAGMEAARTAARRGHQVTLFEKSAELGGQLRDLGRCLNSDVYLQLRDWLARDCAAAGVTLRIGAAATLDAVKSLDPQIVIVATGGAAATSTIKGASKPHVLGAQAALADGARIGANVIVIGGGQVGVQVAARLAGGGHGRAVTVVESTQVPELAYGLSLMERTFTLMTHLPKLGVEARMGLRIDEIRDRDLLTVDAVDGAKEKLKADTVVMALPPQPDAAAAAAWQSPGCVVHVIGEAAQGKTIADAIHDGARVAREI